jgi:hypothetical protein
MPYALMSRELHLRDVLAQTHNHEETPDKPDGGAFCT